MPNIRDRQLSTAYSAYEASRRQDANFQITPQNMIKLLAGAADNGNQNSSLMETALTRPGITRDEQVGLVQKGLSTKERGDLAKILDAGTVPLHADVKRFLEQVLGRTPVTPNDGVLRLTGTQTGGVIKGAATANVTIEAFNASQAPLGRLRNDDTFELGKTGADGKFSGHIDNLREGDVLRLRTRDAQGKTSDWLTIRATGISAKDTNNADVALFRIGLSDAGNGKINLSNINGSRQISEPHAQLLFVNERTNEKTLVKINDKGSFDDGAQLPGKAGDSFSIRATDGVNNTNFSVEAGKVKVGQVGVDPGSSGNVNLPDPALHKDELDSAGKPRFALGRFKGPFIDGNVRPEDVKQGQIGDCYLPSAVAAIAHVQPDVLKNMMKDNGDGSYTYTFKEFSFRTRNYVDKPITVDADLYLRAWGGPLYGSSDGPTGTDKMELWWPLLEKAYAQWKGSYDTIGNGGSSSAVFEAILGRPQDNMNVSPSSDPNRVWNKIKTALDNKLPVSAGTHDEDQKALYTNTGVYPDHSYSVVGYEEKNGTRFVKLRNPWGESEPFPSDGKNDGIFSLKLADFMKLYGTIYSVR